MSNSHTRTSSHENYRDDFFRLALLEYEKMMCEVLATTRDTQGMLVEWIEGQQPPAKGYYTVAEFAELEGKRPYTVREWCRLMRINAEKRETGRGDSKEWKISHNELIRYRNDGLLPPPDRY